MREHGGRSGSSVVIHDLVVTKTVRGPWEPNWMRRFPEVFMPVIATCEHGDHLEYTMPRGEPARWDELTDALPKAATLLRRLWATCWEQHNPRWAEALFDHLDGLRQVHDIQLTRDDVRYLVREASHHQVRQPRCIHGDPTLANLIYDASRPFDRWRWIDPLARPYIPGDPLVDLGKMYQSCLGYERVLAGLEPERDDAMIQQLAEITGLCEHHGLVWCAIHILRLIPYQDEKDRPLFAEMLHDLVSECQQVDGEKDSVDDEEWED